METASINALSTTQSNNIGSTLTVNGKTDKLLESKYNEQEYVDEEDTLSDDSLRLRFSDDEEADTDDVSVKQTSKTQSENTELELNVDAKVSIDEENTLLQENGTVNKDALLGNECANEETVTDVSATKSSLHLLDEKQTQGLDKRKELQSKNNMYGNRPKFDNRWRHANVLSMSMFNTGQPHYGRQGYYNSDFRPRFDNKYYNRSPFYGNKSGYIGKNKGIRRPGMQTMLKSPEQIDFTDDSIVVENGLKDSFNMDFSMSQIKVEKDLTSTREEVEGSTKVEEVEEEVNTEIIEEVMVGGSEEIESKDSKEIKEEKCKKEETEVEDNEERSTKEREEELMKEMEENLEREMAEEVASGVVKERDVDEEREKELLSESYDQEKIEEKVIMEEIEEVEEIEEMREVEEVVEVEELQELEKDECDGNEVLQKETETVEPIVEEVDGKLEEEEMQEVMQNTEIAIEEIIQDENDKIEVRENINSKKDVESETIMEIDENNFLSGSSSNEQIQTDSASKSVEEMSIDTASPSTSGLECLDTMTSSEDNVDVENKTENQSDLEMEVESIEKVSDLEEKNASDEEDGKMSDVSIQEEMLSEVEMTDRKFDAHLDADKDNTISEDKKTGAVVEVVADQLVKEEENGESTDTANKIKEITEVDEDAEVEEGAKMVKHTKVEKHTKVKKDEELDTRVDTDETELVDNAVKDDKEKDEDIEVVSNDSKDAETITRKVNNSVKRVSTRRKQSLSQSSSLKRNISDVNVVDEKVVKKPKMISEVKQSVDVEECDVNNASTSQPKLLQHVRNLFKNENGKFKKLKQEELEELLIQKIVETITMHSEIGKLREQARISEKNQEATRTRCQQLAKQLKDFEMVLKRNAADRLHSNDKYVAPIKINRSVGLQVNLTSDPSIQNLRQLQQSAFAKNAAVVNSSALAQREIRITPVQNNGKGLKVRSPRRTDPVITSPNVTVSTQIQTAAQQIQSTTTTSSINVDKTTESQQVTRRTSTLTLPNNINGVRNAVTVNQSPPKSQQPTPVLNGNVTVSRQSGIGRSNNISNSTTNVQRTTKSSDLIDLTDEEDKKKTPNKTPTVTQQSGQPTILADALMRQQNSPQQASQQQQQIIQQQQSSARYQRVIQTLTGNVTLATNSPPSIRVVQPANQPTPTAIVNNMNASRFTYIMPSGVGQGRQVLITNSNQMRPVTSNNRTQYPTVTYKTAVSGVTTIANGAVARIFNPQACQSIQIPKHPAPLPPTPPCELNPMWKLPPPAPSLKITKTENGIVLSWNVVNLTDKYADIASYQLFAYQEVAGVAPSTALWKKVGDVRSLPLPMACTLTQFSEGNNYYFAVRAVDTHSRLGQYSLPGHISL